MHSIARAHVASREDIVPKAFNTVDREVDGVAVRDGDPVTDRANAQVTLQHEWDLAWWADPARAETTVLETKKQLAEAGKGGASLPVPSNVNEQRSMDRALTNAAKAIHALAVMASTDGRGGDVFGSFEAVDQIRNRLKKMDDMIVTYGPKRPIPAITEDMTGVVTHSVEDGDDE